MAEETKVIDPIFAELKKITKFGYVEGDIIVGEMTLTLSSITADEEAEVFNNCIGYDGLAFITRNKVETIIYSLKAVNGIRFKFLKEIDMDKFISERNETVSYLRKIIYDWQDEVVSHVFREYLNIVQKGEEELNRLGISRSDKVEKALTNIAIEKKKLQEENKEEDKVVK